MSTDWIGTFFGIAGAILVMVDVRVATAIWIISNLAFIIWSIRGNVRSIATLQIVYFAINMTTLIVRWGKP